MPDNSYESVLVCTQADGSALTNSTTPTSLLPASAKTKIWPLYCRSPEKILRITAHGRISTVVTTPGTLTLALRFIDSAANSVDVVSSGAMTLNTTAQTTTPWILELWAHVRALGSTGTLFGYGRFQSHAVIGSSAIGTAGAGTQMLPYNSAPAVGTAFNATLENQIDLFATWSVANASNSITLHNFIVESLN
jgi:hypothetical protein